MQRVLTSLPSEQDILDEQNITEIPKLQAWRSNELLMTSSAQPYFILEALKRHAGGSPVCLPQCCC